MRGPSAPGTLSVSTNVIKITAAAQARSLSVSSGASEYVKMVLIGRLGSAWLGLVVELFA